MPRVLPHQFYPLANHSAISGSTSLAPVCGVSAWKAFRLRLRVREVLQEKVAMASASAATAIPAIAALGSSSYRDNLSSISAAWPRNSFSRNLSFSPLSVTSPANGRNSGIVSMATGDTSDASKTVQDALKSVQDAWEKTDDKLAVGGLGFSALIVLWASAGLIGAIDKLPLIPNFFEFVGILFTGWFIYRYLLFKPDREDLAKKLESALAKITGNEV